MDVCPDYEDLFKLFNDKGIKYLLAGGQAVIYYTEPRYTKDMDIWVIAELNHPEKLYNALREFGVPLKKITVEDLNNKKLIIQIGVAPVRIDLLLNIEGVHFKTAWKNRKRVKYGNTPINIMAIDDLIKAKRIAGRTQDILDLEKLQKVRKRSRKKS